MIDRSSPTGPMDSTTFDHLYQTYANDVLRISFFYLRNRQKAEDVTQDVFMKLYLSAPQLENGKETAWLFKVALNKCRDHWRTAWIKRVTLGDKMLAIQAVEDPLIATMEREHLLNAIHQLPPAFKETVILHYYQQLRIDQIATILAVSPGTVSSRLSRARVKLQRILKGMA